MGFGIVLSTLFLLMLVTGMVLLLHYTPSIERAYYSVKDIVFVVPGGRYIRNIHRWAGHGMVLMCFLHMIRVFYTASYRDGRRTNWIIGIVMMLIVFLMSFSGYLLPWDQLAFWAVTIGSNIAGSASEFTDMIGLTGLVDPGGFIKRLLIGGEQVSQATLSRFFMLHVVFLPVSLVLLMSWHFWRIRKDGGLISPVSQTGDTQVEQNKIYTWPIVMWAEIAVFMLVMAILMIIAYYVDAPLQEQANPVFPENPAKSPWYFLGIQELVSYSAFMGGILVPLLFIVFLVSIPFIDNGSKNTGIWFSGRKGLRLTLISMVVAILVTTSLVFIGVQFGWSRQWYPGSPAWVNMLINPAVISVLIYGIYSLLVIRLTGSQRMAAIGLFTCAIIAWIIFTIIGIWFRGPNWEFFWSSSQWPVI
jgi:quinol-cytochrome oxidoreductase complex cytochrome b subunit